MKLQLLHGPAKVASRKKLIELKQKFETNSVVVYEEGANLQTIIDSLITPSLFSDQQLIILENPPEEFVVEPSLIADNLSLIFWFDHEILEKKPIIKSTKQLQGEVFFYPEAKEVSVFPFLDYLAQKDQKAYLEIEKLKKGGFDIQYFITMVFYLLRNLALTPKNAPHFVRDKLERQRKNFDLTKITNLYKEILEIDFKIKSGLLEKDQAEFSLINLFCH